MKLAGDEKKLAKLEPGDCDCESNEPKRQSIPVEELCVAAAVGAWFAKYDYGNGIVIQAGPEPEIAPVELDPKPAIYVLPAMTLKEVRLMADLSLHYGSKDGEPRLTGFWPRRSGLPDSTCPRTN